MSNRMKTHRIIIALLAAVALLAPIAAPAQPAAAPIQPAAALIQPTPKSPPIHGLAHIAIRVTDIANSRAFYEKLGFQQSFDMQKDGIVTQSFLKVNDRQFIELYPKTEKDPTLGFLHLCFDGEDLNALHDFNVANGLTPTAVRKAGAGNMLFTQRGPEDQNIEYTQYMPGSLHYSDRGKHLGESGANYTGPGSNAARIADNFFAVSLGMKDVPAASAFYIAKLGFPPAPGSKTLFPIPGSHPATESKTGPKKSADLDPALTTPASRIFLYVPSLSKTSAELNKRGIAFRQAKQSLTVTDPDGNQLIFTSALKAG